MAVCVVLVGLVKLPSIMVAFVALKPPESPPVTAGADQLYEVPAGTIPFIPFAGVRLNNVPLQITLLMVVIIAAGLTVTVTEKATPVQLPAIGVTT